MANLEVRELIKILNIQDLDLLKITKVKPWAIYFTYDNEKYLLHGSGECGEYDVTLYKRIPLSNTGKFELEYLSGCLCTSDNIWYYYIRIKDKIPNRIPKIVYNQINKSYFVREMTKNILCSSLYSKELKEWKIYQKNKLEEIKELEKQIRNIKEDIRIKYNKIGEC